MKKQLLLAFYFLSGAAHSQTVQTTNRFFSPATFGRPFVSEMSSYLNKLEVGPGENHSEYDVNRLPAQADDSQASIEWNADQHRLEGRAFAHNGQPLRLVIDLPMFSLQFLEKNDQSVASFVAEGKTPDDATAWWQTVMHDWGFDMTKPLSYQLETAPLSSATPYIRPAGLIEWANWRTVAHQKLIILNELSGRTSDIRILKFELDEAGRIVGMPRARKLSLFGASTEYEKEALSNGVTLLDVDW